MGKGHATCVMPQLGIWPQVTGMDVLSVSVYRSPSETDAITTFCISHTGKSKTQGLHKSKFTLLSKGGGAVWRA